MKRFKPGDLCKLKSDKIKQLAGKDFVVVSVWGGKHEIYTVQLGKCYYNVLGSDIVLAIP
ncbi:hypothetical protein EBV26_17775 [bacterium]|jgi:hypothetical protein|nr:hypothetical protein [bacterium]